MGMEHNVFFHIGLYKTGSTFLQRNVFQQLAGVDYYGRDYRKFVFGQKIDTTTLISNEGLSGSPLTHRDDRLMKLDMIKKFYPDAKIICVSRHPLSWVYSLYNQYVKRGGVHTFKKWVRYDFNIVYLDIDFYIRALNDRFNDILFLDFDDLVKDVNVFVETICNFIGVDIPVFDSKVRGKGLDGMQLECVRFLNRFGINFFKVYYRYDTWKNRFVANRY